MKTFFRENQRFIFYNIFDHRSMSLSHAQNDMRKKILFICKISKTMIWSLKSWTWWKFFIKFIIKMIRSSFLKFCIEKKKNFQSSFFHQVHDLSDQIIVFEILHTNEIFFSHVILCTWKRHWTTIEDIIKDESLIFFEKFLSDWC
jgi:hypothetical protein